MQPRQYYEGLDNDFFYHVSSDTPSSEQRVQLLLDSVDKQSLELVDDIGRWRAKLGTDDISSNATGDSVLNLRPDLNERSELLIARLDALQRGLRDFGWFRKRLISPLLKELNYQEARILKVLYRPAVVASVASDDFESSENNSSERLRLGEGRRGCRRLQLRRCRRRRTSLAALLWSRIYVKDGLILCVIILACWCLYQSGW